jgi:4-carboxymuconolactone decarboxylase
MPRLPLLTLAGEDPLIAAVLETCAREGRDPNALERVLAHSPLMLRAHAGLARGLRYDAQTPRALRELVILRVAQLTANEYAWAHHRAMAQEHGVVPAQVTALATWRSSDLFDARERAALRCVDEIHDVAVSDEAFAELEALVGSTATVELVLHCAFYEGVARIVQAFALEVEPVYQHFRGGRDDETCTR